MVAGSQHSTDCTDNHLTHSQAETCYDIIGCHRYQTDTVLLGLLAKEDDYQLTAPVRFIHANVLIATVCKKALIFRSR